MKRGEQNDRVKSYIDRLQERRFKARYEAIDRETDRMKRARLAKEHIANYKHLMTNYRMLKEMNNLWQVVYEKMQKCDINFKEYQVLYNPILKAITLENDKALLIFTNSEIIVTPSTSEQDREKRISDMVFVSLKFKHTRAYKLL